MPPKSSTPRSARKRAAPTASASSTPAPHLSDAKVPLPDLLKQLSVAGGLPMSEAMAVAGKLLKAGFDSPAKLAGLSLFQLEDLGVEPEETRKKVVSAFSGKGKGKAPKRPRYAADMDFTIDDPSASSASGPSRRKKPMEEQMDFNFEEILDEDALKTRYTVINRAPVMTAWACVVAERLGFSRSEALSLAQTYTSMNAVSRGVSIGVFDASKREETKGGPNQPHIDLMGVRVPVMKMQNDEWRGLSKGSVVEPSKAFAYLRRSLAQTLPSLMGALTLLANSYEDVEELNRTGYGLYCEFRPETAGEWGKRGRVECATVLGLRRVGAKAETKDGEETEGVKDELDEEDMPEDAPAELGERSTSPSEERLERGLVRGTKSDEERRDTEGSPSQSHPGKPTRASRSRRVEQSEGPAKEGAS